MGLMPKLHMFLPGALGDLLIDLPIAGYYRDVLGYNEIFWPIHKKLYPTMSACAPWINWYPLPFEPTIELGLSWEKYFVECGLPNFLVPTEENTTFLDITHLHPVPNEADMHLKFDQWRYHLANVPFIYKWKLGEYITRYPDQEQEVIQKLTTPGVPYVVTHTVGSSTRMTLDLSNLTAQGIQVIEIVPGVTPNAVNWLGLIEGAEALYMYDSSFANLVDQMQITVPKLFFRRSAWQMTPVMGMNWEFRGAPPDIIEQLEADYKKQGFPEDYYRFQLDNMRKEKETRERCLREKYGYELTGFGN